jgi:hypothetical protein
MRGGMRGIAQKTVEFGVNSRIGAVHVTIREEPAYVSQRNVACTCLTGTIVVTTL